MHSKYICSWINIFCVGKYRRCEFRSCAFFTKDAVLNINPPFLLDFEFLPIVISITLVLSRLHCISRPSLVSQDKVTMSQLPASPSPFTYTFLKSVEWLASSNCARNAISGACWSQWIPKVVTVVFLGFRWEDGERRSSGRHLGSQAGRRRGSPVSTRGSASPQAAS